MVTISDPRRKGRRANQSACIAGSQMGETDRGLGTDRLAGPGTRRSPCRHKSLPAATRFCRLASSRAPGGWWATQIRLLWNRYHTEESK